MRKNGLFRKLMVYVSLCLVMLLHVGVVTAQNTSPLCFTARNGSVTVRFNIKNVTHTIQYSTDSLNWNTYTSNSNVVLNADQSVYFRAELNQDSAYSFGKSRLENCSRLYCSSSNGGFVEGSGNIMSLYGPDCPNLPLREYAFANMFYDCNIITSTPLLPDTLLADHCYEYMFKGCTALTSVSPLSAHTLAYECYIGMFKDCASLTVAPALPATTLANNCYQWMFEGCTSLVDAPELPATVLAYGCYGFMFNGCSSLVSSPILPARNLAPGCYAVMFGGCTSLKEAPELPATTLASRCYMNMFKGCTSIKKTPTLHATTLADNCYHSMFYGCTSLTSISALPATTLVSQCYRTMFDSCVSLKVDTSGTGKQWKIPAATTENGNEINGMFFRTGGTMNLTPELNTIYYISSDTTITPLCFTAKYGDIIVKFDIKNITHTIQYSADDSIWNNYISNDEILVHENQKIYFKAASNQTVATAFGSQQLGNSSRFYFSSTNGGKVEASGSIMSLYGADTLNLPLQPYAFAFMFDSCTTLISSPILPSTVLANNCYNGLFYGCTSLIESPVLPATILASDCYHDMFYGCVALTIAPSLNTTTLSDNCYSSMFYGCTSLTIPPKLPATTLANACYHDMFRNCYNLLFPPELPATTLADHCYERMFYYCTSLTTLPKLPATTLTTCCYYRMFWGCSSLRVNTTWPGNRWAIQVNTTASQSVDGMFRNTGGTMTSTPSVNTTYYIASDSTPVHPLCFTARGGTVTVKFEIKNISHSIQYSTDGYNWNNYPSKTIITLYNGGTVYFRAESNQTVATAFGSASGSNYCSRFYFSSTNGGKIEGSGDIMSLYGPDCPDVLPNNAFSNLFYGCSLLTKAPELSATNLTNECYSGMFSECTSLTAAPSLSALTLGPNCYDGMFSGCSSLINAPSLPAMNLSYGCYSGMYVNCTSLVNAPMLPATTMASWCYSRMFYNCTSLIKAPFLPATTLYAHCYESMFDNCSSLVTLPSLPAITLAEYCYNYMFRQCASLVLNTAGQGKQWSIPATTTANHAVLGMFDNTGGTMNNTPSLNTTYYLASGVNEVTVNANNPSMGSVSGSGYYVYNEEAILSATSNPHYHFVSWSNGQNEQNITVLPYCDTTFTANFAIDQHNVNVSATNGQVNGGGLHDYGSTVSLTASPNQHYHFVSWSDGNTSNPRSIVVNGDTTLTANFEIDKHTITSSGTHGTVSGGGTYDYGSTITLKATPNNHYYFARWSDNDTTNPRTITVSANKTYTAVFEGDMHTITTKATNGSVTGGGSYHYGSTVTLSATPNQHYHFKQWSDGNTSNPRTFSVYADSTFTAIFEIDKHTVSASGPNGTISGTGSYDYGSSATLTATPNAHYHFFGWTDGDTANPRTIYVLGNCSYSAIFEIDRHVVTVGGTNGVVAGGGTYDYGSSVTLTATADDHYHFARWSDGDVSNPRNIVVSGDLTYTALFEIDKHTVAVNANNGVVSGGGEYDYGSTVNLTAVPDDYYCDVIWSDGDSDLTKSFVITGDVELTADFVKCQYVVSATCEHGEVTGSGVYENPEIVTLVAFADDGYRFVEWSDGNEYNPRIFVVEGDLEVEAICEVVAGVEDVEESVVFYYVDGRVVNPEGIMLRVYSTEGKMVKSSDSDIVTEGWPAGMYMVVDEKGSTLKVMVKK